MVWGPCPVRSRRFSVVSRLSASNSGLGACKAGSLWFRDRDRCCTHSCQPPNLFAVVSNPIADCEGMGAHPLFQFSECCGIF